MKDEIKKPCRDFSNDPLAQRVLAEGLAIQDRFAAEPVFAKTGKGYLKSSGVQEIAEYKQRMAELAEAR